MRLFLVRALVVLLGIALIVVSVALPVFSWYAKSEVQAVARQYGNPSLSGRGGQLNGTYRVLLVSDLHLDMTGAMLFRSFADYYGADLVINTGDMGIFGTWVEGQQARAMLAGGPLQVFVPGNHDLEPFVGELKRNVVVLDDSEVSVDGLTIYGLADPVSHLKQIQPNNRMAAVAAAMAAGELREQLRSGEETPDIIAVHNSNMVPYFTNLTNTIVYGHSHRQGFGRVGSAWTVNPGSANGMQFLRLFPPKVQILPSRGLAVMYYTAKMPRRLIAVDEIQLCNQGDARVNRYVVEESLLTKN